MSVTLAATPACQTDWWPELGSGQPDGVPLAEFEAADGQYFPEFIQNVFPGAQGFSRRYPSLDQARHGLKMIQVKPLNGDDRRKNEANLSWSADGVYLGFEVAAGDHRKIMLKNLAGDYARELKLIPKGRRDFLDGMVVRSAHSYNAGLEWSRDSTRFAFMSNGGVGQYNIYVGAVGAKEKAIAKSPTKDGYATWSPASEEIAFVSARSGNGDIYSIRINSGQVTRLSRSEAVDIFPAWSPDGRHLVYSSGDALDHDLYMIEREETDEAWSGPIPLTRWSHDDLRPTISPDGRFVAFYTSADPGRRRKRRWNILVVPLKGGPFDDSELRAKVVAKDVVIDLNTGPAWSPDSRKIFYVDRDPSAFNPIQAYDLFSGRRYRFETGTRMNRDILMSRLGVLSFRAQVGAWDRVFVALTNQGRQIQHGESGSLGRIHYDRM